MLLRLTLVIFLHLMLTCSTGLCLRYWNEHCLVEKDTAVKDAEEADSCSLIIEELELTYRRKINELDKLIKETSNKMCVAPDDESYTTDTPVTGTTKLSNGSTAQPTTVPTLTTLTESVVTLKYPSPHSKLVAYLKQSKVFTSSRVEAALLAFDPTDLYEAVKEVGDNPWDSHHEFNFWSIANMLEKMTRYSESNRIESVLVNGENPFHILFSLYAAYQFRSNAVLFDTYYANDINRNIETFIRTYGKALINGGSLRIKQVSQEVYEKGYPEKGNYSVISVTDTEEDGKKLINLLVENGAFFSTIGSFYKIINSRIKLFRY